MKKTIKRIVICGNYGATNLGDEAILAGILKSVREAVPGAKITVLSANPRETARTHRVKSAHLLPTGFRSAFRAVFCLRLFRTLYHIARCRLFILGGGGLFTDEKPFAIFLWGLHAKCAHFFRKPVYMYAQGIGPLDSKLSQKIVQRIFRKAAEITVRDQESKNLLDLIGVDQRVKVTADPAFLLDTPKPSPENYAILSVRPWIKTPSKLYKILAQYVDWLYAEYQVKTLLLPFQRVKDNDRAELRKIFDQLGNKKAAELLKWKGDLQQVLELFASAKLAVGMRLHSMIFACLANTPFIGLIYSPKVKSFLRSVGRTESGIEMHEMSFEKLKKETKKLWVTKPDFQRTNKRSRNMALKDKNFLTKLLF